MKKILALVLVLAMALALVACGAPAEEAPATTAAAEAPAETAAAEAPAGESLSGTIRYVSMWNETEPQADVIKAAIEEFTTMYPDVTIEIQWMGRDILKTIVASLDAGQVDLWDQSINHVVKKYNDYGYDLTELMAQPSDILGGKSYNDVANKMLVQNIKETAPDGTLKALPFIPNCVAVFYNQDHFAEAGVEVPTTWEEFLTVCEALKAAGHTPLSLDDGYVVLPFGMYIGRQMGLEFVEKLITDASTWDDPAVLAAAKEFENIWNNGYMSVNAASNKYPMGQNEVAMGDASMYLVGSYMLNEVREIAGDDFPWGAFAFPSPEGAALPTTANTYGQQVLQIPANAQDPELSYAFASFLASGKYAAQMAAETNNLPATMDAEWPELLSCTKTLVEETTHNIPWACGIDGNADFTPVYKENAQKLLGGQISAEEFVAACKAALG